MMSTPSAALTTAVGPSYHTITLPDGTITKYLLRGLRTDNEDSNITEWTNFCALAFAHKKPTPPSAMYFLRHYTNDPRHDANFIRVMMSLNPENEKKEEEMASSVRIFRRTLSSGPGGSSSSLTYEAGGIGEVCTSPNHRRRGLSTILLHDALTIMQHDNSSNNNNSGGMSCSLLHASSDFRPYYTKVGGYQSIRSLWSVVPIVYTNLTSSLATTTTTNDTIISNAKTQFSVRCAIFPQDASRLFHLYQLYSEQRLVTIVRSLEYWEKYVSVELSNSLYVLTMLDTDDCDVNDCNIIVAWMSIKEKGNGRYQLREFGIDREQITTTLAMNHLLHVTLDQVMGEEDEGVSLLLPSFVLSEIKEESMMNEDSANDKQAEDASFMKIDDATEENDDGWMYVNFENSSSPMNIVEILTREHDRVPHLIWPTDSF